MGINDRQFIFGVGLMLIVILIGLFITKASAQPVLPSYISGMERLYVDRCKADPNIHHTMLGYIEERGLGPLTWMEATRSSIVIEWLDGNRFRNIVRKCQ